MSGDLRGDRRVNSDCSASDIYIYFFLASGDGHGVGDELSDISDDWVSLVTGCQW